MYTLDLHVYLFKIQQQFFFIFFSENETKVLRLERTNRELERSLQALKQSSVRVNAEVEKTNKKLTAQIHADKKEIARLKEVCKIDVVLTYNYE